jgi:hypothetical protein
MNGMFQTTYHPEDIFQGTKRLRTFHLGTKNQGHFVKDIFSRAFLTATDRVLHNYDCTRNRVQNRNLVQNLRLKKNILLILFFLFFLSSLLSMLTSIRTIKTVKFNIFRRSFVTIYKSESEISFIVYLIFINHERAIVRLVCLVSVKIHNRLLNIV